MSVDLLLGLQWGDEGKGKIIDYLAPKYDVIARFQGGPNAGHTLVINGEKTVLHTVPSGIFQERPMNVIGNGVIIDPITLKKEIIELLGKGVQIKNKLLISKKAHFIIPTHLILDAASEHAKGESKIGSTLRGISPTYQDKTGRNGLRVGDALSPDFKNRYEKLKEKHLTLLKLYPDFAYEVTGEAEWFEAVEYLKSLDIFSDTEYYLNDQLQKGKSVLAEGAQGTMLDIDFGTYPYVTSSNTISSGACQGLGISPTRIKEVIGIAKAYCTRVGGGPFPTELWDKTGERLRRIGNEFGATTGRPRRCGWIDLPQLKYAVMINGVTQIAMTKADVLNKFSKIQACRAYEIDGLETDQLPFDLCSTDVGPKYLSFEGWKTNITKCTSFDELPKELHNYMNYIGRQVGAPITMLSTSPERKHLLIR
jgi:adenylosuccinate synthase